MMKRSWHDHFAFGWKPLFASFVLVGIVCALFLANDPMVVISAQQAEQITPVSLKEYQKANFEGRFVLRGLNVQCGPAGLEVKIAWESNISQSLSFTNAIHLVDQDGNILSQSDYKQPVRWRNAKSGDIWLDEILIPLDQIHRETKSMAIGLYDDSGRLLQIDHGHTDWGGRRLVMPVGACQ